MARRPIPRAPGRGRPAVPHLRPVRGRSDYKPTIIASALAEGDRYDGLLRDLAARGADVDKAVFTITDDVRTACDVLAPVYERTGGRDGRVSIEVDPRLAGDTAATTATARALHGAVDRDNLFVKSPATPAGLEAIRQVTEGISVNVTLIFALARYREIMNAYLSGLSRPRPRAGTLPRSGRSPRCLSRGWTAPVRHHRRRPDERASTTSSTGAGQEGVPPRLPLTSAAPPTVRRWRLRLRTGRPAHVQRHRPSLLTGPARTWLPGCARPSRRARRSQ